MNDIDAIGNIVTVREFLNNAESNVVNVIVTVETEDGIYRAGEFSVTVIDNKFYYSIIIPFQNNKIFKKLCIKGVIQEIYNTALSEMYYSSLFRCLIIKHNNVRIRIYTL